MKYETQTIDGEPVPVIHFDRSDIDRAVEQYVFNESGIDILNDRALFIAPDDGSISEEPVKGYDGRTRQDLCAIILRLHSELEDARRQISAMRKEETDYVKAFLRDRLGQLQEVGPNEQN